MHFRQNAHCSVGITAEKYLPLNLNFGQKTKFDHIRGIVRGSQIC